MRPNDFNSADLDGDGRVDLFTATDESVEVFWNASVPGAAIDFTAPTVLEVISPQWSVVAADIDGDGKLDLIGATPRSESISVHRNLGARKFDRPLMVPSGGRAYFAVVGDWDQDGDLDLAAANVYEQSVAILENVGRLEFSEPRIVPMGSSPYSLAVGDLDENGFPDIVATSPDSDKVTVLVNRKGEFFELPFASGEGPRFSALGDVNADGSIDIVTGNYDSRDLTVFLNRPSRRPQSRGFAHTLCTAQDFGVLSVSTPGRGRAVKFTVPAREDGLVAAVFQDSRRFTLHQDFLSEVFADRFPQLTAEALARITQFRESRDYFIGMVERACRPGGCRLLFSLISPRAFSAACGPEKSAI